MSEVDQHLETPVAVFVFNRPQTTAEVMAAVRAAQPQTLVVVADGPRLDHPDDRQRCAAAQAIATEIDWDCDLHVVASSENLGCDVRLQSGLDEVFAIVDRAIVLEDDVVPARSMFGWCQRMLDRYRDDPSVAMVAARNPLGIWGPHDADHLLARRGSIHGWATWARAWNGADRTWPTWDDERVRTALEGLHLPTLVAQQVERIIDLARAGDLTAWDNHWGVTHLLADQWTVVSTLNLTRNIGFGADATRTLNAQDLRAALPVLEVRPATSAAAVRDPDFDAASMTIDLLAAHLQPDVSRRLAKYPHLFCREDGTPDDDLILHLAPFADRKRSLELVSHLRRIGTSSPTLDRLIAALDETSEGS
jgi:hypothetical protein